MKLGEEPLPTVAILAGGRGTRLGPMVERVPKPLVTVAGKPFLYHLVARLAGWGVRRIVICAGYLGDEIERTIGRAAYGVEIGYSYDEPGLSGTLGALRLARKALGERFLVHYGDTLLTLDLCALVRTWNEMRSEGILAVLKNGDRWGRSNTDVRTRMVLCHDKQHPAPEWEWIDYGVAGLTSSSLDAIASNETDLSLLYRALAAKRQLSAFGVSKRFFEIGTPEALRETERHLHGRDRGK